jgi:hypothetical protein
VRIPSPALLQYFTMQCMPSGRQGVPQHIIACSPAPLSVACALSWHVCLEGFPACTSWGCTPCPVQVWLCAGVGGGACGFVGAGVGVGTCVHSLLVCGEVSSPCICVCRFFHHGTQNVLLKQMLPHTHPTCARSLTAISLSARCFSRRSSSSGAKAAPSPSPALLRFFPRGLDPMCAWMTLCWLWCLVAARIEESGDLSTHSMLTALNVQWRRVSIDNVYYRVFSCLADDCHMDAYKMWQSFGVPRTMRYSSMRTFVLLHDRWRAQVARRTQKCCERRKYAQHRRFPQPFRKVARCMV